ncbi:trypsin-like peptidase domain-containing protein [Phormidium tenue FACHB-886]|nr:trypsin-like peptidase domain-containing protein [Phormidium tenue FACHB-886]
MQQKPRSKARKPRKFNKRWQRVIRPIALPLLNLAEKATLVFGQLGRKYSILLLTLLIWVIAALLLRQLTLEGNLEANQPQFERAYQATLQIVNAALENAPPALQSQSNYGISQNLYDDWQRSQNQPPQDISRLSDTEARSLYQRFWQQGNCGSYAAPMDTVCLDTLVSFGIETGRTFLTDLPTDPTRAAMTVAQQRSIYRRQALERLSRPNAPPNERLRQTRLAQVGGLRRDRALIALVENPVAFQPPTPSPPPSNPLPGWFKLPFPGRPDTPTLLSASQVHAKAEPFTVEVWITLEDGTNAPATGVILSTDGLILTNAHVVANNPNPTIRIRSDRQTERQYPGRVVATDRRIDLALVQLSGASGLPVAPLAHATTQVKVGDTVYALGSPTGSHWKLTQAQVIAVQSACGLPSLKCIRMPKGFLEPGNSGGPLLDTSGTVIGINRALQESTGEGVSIPIETVKQFLAEEKG